MGRFVERTNKRERNMGLDGNGKQGSSSTFSSKKVDWTQASEVPEGKERETGENKRTNYIKLLDIQVF